MAVRPAGPKNAQVAKNLGKAAQSLEKSAKRLEKKGERRDRDAFGTANAAGAEALGATAQYSSAVSQGIAGWSSDDVGEGARYVAKGVAHGLSSVATMATRLTGDGHPVTVRQLERDPQAVRFAGRMFDNAGRQLLESRDAMTSAWASYGESVSRLASIDAPAAAAHVAAVANSLAKAAALTTSPGATRLAEYGVRLADAAAVAAERHTPGARELISLAARFAGTTADTLSRADPVEARGNAKEALSLYQGELRELQKSHPGLAVGRLVA